MSGVNHTFSDLEPNGHIGHGSKIERYWKSTHSSGALWRRRVQAFDEVAGMSYFPMLYNFEPFSLEADSPTDEWMTSQFASFVRDEFQGSGNVANPNFELKISSRLLIDETTFLAQFLAEGEDFDFESLPSGADSDPQEMASLIYDILCIPSIGSPKNKKNVEKAEFVSSLSGAINRRERLLFVLPGFPFKDQNRFRVPFSAAYPDLSEILFLIRLHRVTQAIYHVHPFGADVVVLSDGSLYSEIFGVPDDMASEYFRRIISYRDRLNLQGTISILSLKDLIDRCSEDGKGAWHIADEIRRRLPELIRKDSELENTFETLIRGMKWNMNSRTMLESVDSQTAWDIVRGSLADVAPAAKNAWSEFDHAAREAALQYASMNLMLRRTKLIERFFPSCIRGTVHPKPGQFALSSPSTAFSWNGVAWSSVWPATISSVEVKPFTLLSTSEEVMSVVFTDSELPCCYIPVINNKSL